MVYRVQRKVRLVGCVLSSKVWYHVAVRLTRPRINRFAALATFSSREGDVSIILNGKLVLKEKKKLPKFQEHSDSPYSLSMGSGISSAGPIFRRSQSTGTPLSTFGGELASTLARVPLAKKHRPDPFA